MLFIVLTSFFIKCEKLSLIAALTDTFSTKIYVNPKPLRETQSPGQRSPQSRFPRIQECALEERALKGKLSQNSLRLSLKFYKSGWKSLSASNMIEYRSAPNNLMPLL